MPKKLVKLFLLSFTFCISFQEKIAKLKKKGQTKISPEKVRALVISLFYERFCLVWQRKPVLTSSPFTILFFNHERQYIRSLLCRPVRDSKRSLQGYHIFSILVTSSNHKTFLTLSRSQQLKFMKPITNEQMKIFNDQISLEKI